MALRGDTLTGTPEAHSHCAPSTPASSSLYSGWIAALSTLKKDHLPVSVIMMVVAGFFTLCAVLSLFLLKRVSGGCWATSSLKKQVPVSYLHHGDVCRRSSRASWVSKGAAAFSKALAGGQAGLGSGWPPWASNKSGWLHSWRVHWAGFSHPGLFPQVHSLYRRTGASFQQAQEEFSQGIFSSRTVRSAASSAARGAFQGN